MDSSTRRRTRRQRRGSTVQACRADQGLPRLLTGRPLCLLLLPVTSQTFGEGVHKVKVYHHYAYYVEAAPPFRCAVVH